MADSCKTYLIPALALLMATTSSCIFEKEPFCPEDGVEFAIVNDWINSPDAAPEGMAYLFFRTDVSAPWRFDFPGREAGKVALQPGDYKFVMYNDDTSGIIFTASPEGMPFATTATDSIRIDGRRIEARKSPDMMWGCSIAEVKVDFDGIEYSSDSTAVLTRCDKNRYTLVTHPRQITPVYTVRVLHVENLQGVAAMKGLISGMASGINLYGEAPSADAVAVAFVPRIAPNSTVIAGFNTFGLPSSGAVTNELHLYFMLSDARIEDRSYDVTATVAAASDPMHVEIVIDSIRLPYAPPFTEGGGFSPMVEGWTTVEVNYEI